MPNPARAELALLVFLCSVSHVFLLVRLGSTFSYEHLIVLPWKVIWASLYSPLVLQHWQDWCSLTVPKYSVARVFW